MFELKSTVNLSQSLALTPELKQALKILALDDQELEELTSEEFTNNFALEESEGSNDEPVLDHWRVSSNVSLSPMDWEGLQATSSSLWENLQDQLIESSFNTIEKEIGNRLIQEMDENGYFSGSTEDLSVELCLPESWIESVRKRMLQFDPVGVLAKTLDECVLAQASVAKPPPNKLLLHILSMNLLEKAAANATKVAKKLGCTKSEVGAALSEVSRFRRYPGQPFEDQDKPIIGILPHVEVVNSNGSLRVTNLRSVAPHLRVDRKALKGHQGDERLRAFVKQNTQRAVSLLSALNRREQTIVRVVECIAKHQEAWFLCKEPLLPLTMKQLASDLNIHESTVSRAVANKFLRCERGTFAIRSFFVSQVSSSSDEKPHSSDAIKDSILRLISKENRRNPLSDEQIYRNMCENKLFVARRTIAKYRAQMKIPARSNRKEAH